MGSPSPSANYPDLLMTRGLYQHRAEPPFVPGLEAAGTILELATHDDLRVARTLAVDGVPGALVHLGDEAR